MAEHNTGKTASLDSIAHLNLGEIIFSRMPMGIAIFDRQQRLVRNNQTWAEFIERYTPSSLNDVQAGVTLSELAPGAEAFFGPVFERVFAGETIRLDAFETISGGIVSYWDVVFSPLTEDGEVVGILDVTTDATERVLLQRNLEQRVAERTEELERRRDIAESLKVILSVLNSSRSLEDTLSVITEQACKVLQSEVCLVHKINYDDNFVAIEASYGLPEELQIIAGFPLFSSPQADNNILSREPVWIENFSEQKKPTEEQLTELHPDIRRWRQMTNKYFQAWLAVPLVVSDEVYGSLAFYYADPQIFDEEKTSLSQSFADQAALAIENARLYEEVRKASAAAERNRLARDLHDAVTQTLFSSSMIADVLPKIWERDPEEGRRNLEELRLLTRGALSEMRTLLVELRPTALADTNLKDLIQHQVNAFYARTGVSVEYKHQGQDDPSPEVKEVFYRVTQEAFNNIAKHADADTVKINLSCLADRISLEIMDDGIGFSTGVDGKEGLGLGIMKERAQNIGGVLTIDSQVGTGTSLQITWSRDSHEEHTHE